MKKIIKINEPKSLVEHRSNRPAFYSNLPLLAKKELEQNLLTEQGHICCYCMQRIPNKVVKGNIDSYDMKVEHFKCQVGYPDLQLVYSNLLGACTGNEGKPGYLATCDTKKGNQELTI